MLGLMKTFAGQTTASCGMVQTNTQNIFKKIISIK